MIRVVLTIHCLEIQALSALPTKPHSSEGLKNVYLYGLIVFASL